MRSLLPAALLALSVPASAQPTQAAFDSLKARVALLDSIVSSFAVAPRPAADKLERSAAVSGMGVHHITGLGTGIVLKDEIGGSVENVFFSGGIDNGLRILYNHRAAWDGAPTHSVASLPQLRIDFEQDGAISFNYNKRLDVQPGPFDALPGKDILFRPGGQTTEGGPRAEFAWIASGLTGRGLRLGAVDVGNGPNWPVRWGVQIKGDGSPDPVSLFIGGALRQLKACSVGGQVVVCL